MRAQFQKVSKVHIRRCHICGGVCESRAALVQKCSDCGKVLAPFYYFDESRAMDLKTQAECDAEYKSSALPFREYPPVWGLTVYWDEDCESN